MAFRILSYTLTFLLPILVLSVVLSNKVGRAGGAGEEDVWKVGGSCIVLDGVWGEVSVEETSLHGVDFLGDLRSWVITCTSSSNRVGDEVDRGTGGLMIGAGGGLLAGLLCGNDFLGDLLRLEASSSISSDSDSVS